MINERTERHINKLVKLNSLVDARDQKIVDLNEEVESLKEEAALLRKYEAVSQQQLEKAKAEKEEIRFSLCEYGDRIVEARTCTWNLYNFLVLEQSKGLDIDLDQVREIIEILHD